MSLKKILEAARASAEPHELDLIERAYYFAQMAHKGQKRKSGEDYFIHCVAVAQILADLHLDPPVVAAGLLHDVVEDNDEISVEHVVDYFSEEVASLVDGVTKLEQIDIQPREGGNIQTREADYLRKTLQAMNDDVRVILIKLADRLHNMRTLSHLSTARRKSIARETLEIFAPLASRLGIWQWKWELEDLSLRYLEPDTYKSIARQIDKRRNDRETNLAKVVKRLQELLDEAGIESEITGRPKHIYSIYRKMESKHLSFEEIYDIRAVRVLVEEEATCYQVLGIVHDVWRPIPGQFDDYVGAPKDNSYQSLHTAVIDDDGETFEVQIRTRDMHQRAEWGIAAHWHYKAGQRQRDEGFEKWINYLRGLMSAGEDAEDADDYLDVMRAEVFEDRVYAFTPNGDIIDLPKGATPIDFAYHIHTDIGDRCRGAKVNGRLVSLDYHLKSGDRINILTVKRGGPSRDWLNPHLGFVKTKRARTKIRQWFRRQSRAQMVGQGREVLERELKRLGVDNMSHEQVASLFGFAKTEEFLAQVGFSEINPQQIATKVLDLERRSSDNGAESRIVSTAPDGQMTATGVHVLGTGGLLTNLARCCNPIQGDDIIGYITRGRGVTIHRKECTNVLAAGDKERLISVEWGGAVVEERYPVPIVISAYDREGLIRDISIVVADEHVNMREVRVQTNNNLATVSIVMEIASTAQLSRVLSRVEQLPNVIEARRRTQG
jgi:GTP pyrophosphokinase